MTKRFMILEPNRILNNSLLAHSRVIGLIKDSFELEISKEEKAERKKNKELLFLSDNDLLTDLRAGKRKTIEFLFDHYAGTLFGVIARITKDSQVAETLLLQTFTLIKKQSNEYEPLKSTLFTWMMKIARNCALIHRNNKNSVVLDYADNPVNLQYRTVKGVNNPKENDKAMILNSTYRPIIDLIYFEGYTHIEAAKKLGMTVNVLKIHLQGIVSTMRMYFT